MVESRMQRVFFFDGRFRTEKEVTRHVQLTRMLAAVVATPRMPLYIPPPKLPIWLRVRVRAGDAIFDGKGFCSVRRVR